MNPWRVGRTKKTGSIPTRSRPVTIPRIFKEILLKLEESVILTFTGKSIAEDLLMKEAGDYSPNSLLLISTIKRATRVKIREGLKV
jgi:hypothetical protein